MSKYNFEDFKRIVPYSYNHVQLYLILNQYIIIIVNIKKSEDAKF